MKRSFLKRLLMLILAAGLITGSFCGCGAAVVKPSGQTSMKAEAVKTETARETAPETEEPEEILPEFYDFLDIGEERCWTITRGDAEAINLHFTEVTETGCVVEWEPTKNYVFDPEYGYKINGQHLGRQECTFRMEKINTEFHTDKLKMMAIDGIDLDVNGRKYVFATVKESSLHYTSEDNYKVVACPLRGSTNNCLPGYIDEDEVWGNAEPIAPLTDHWQSEWQETLDSFLFKDTWENRYDDLPQELKDRLGEQKVSLLADDWMIWYPWLRKWVASYSIIEVSEMDLSHWFDYEPDQSKKEFWKDAERGVSVYVQVNYDDAKTDYTKENLLIIYMYGQWIVTGFNEGFGFEESPAYLAMYGDSSKLEKYMPAVEGDHLFDILPYYPWYHLYAEFSGAAVDQDLDAILALFPPEDMQSEKVRQNILDGLNSFLSRKDMNSQRVYEYSFERPNDKGAYTGSTYADGMELQDSVMLKVEFRYTNTDYNMTRKAKYNLYLIKVNDTWYIGDFENAGEGGGNS